MGESLNETVAAAILFPGLCLLLMIFAYQVKSVTKVPTAPLLILIGIGLRGVGHYIGHLENSITVLTEVNKEVVTLALLPILIFESSFRMDWYIIKKQIWQIIPLSTTVMISCSVLTAVALKYVLNYDYSWEYLFRLGIILSATDNIAANALLKDIYASDHLESLIEGESMFNNASVLVVFSVLIEENIGVTSGISHFVRYSFGGFVVGIIVSFLLGFFIKRLLNKFYIETNFILVAAYLMYWVCEKSEVQVSGAVALVSFGLYMAAYGKTLISPSIEVRLQEFLNLMCHNIESIVLIIGGIIFGNSGVYDSSLLETKDYYCLFILIPLIYLIRAIVLLVHFPFLKVTGYGLTFKELCLIWISGMKGVISIVLILILHQDAFIEEEHFKMIVVYFGIGTAGFSILFGNLGTRLFVKFLGLEEMNDVQENMLIGVTSALVEVSEREIGELENNKDLKLIDWDYALSTAGPASLVKAILKKSKVGKQVLMENPEGEAPVLLKKFSLKFTLSKSALAIEMRRRYLATLKGIYWSQVEEGLCHSNTSLILIDSCNMCLDQESEPMKDWIIVRNLSYKDDLIRLYIKLSTWPLIGRIFRKMLYKAIILAYDAANNFIKCHEETEKLIDEMEIDIDKDIFEEVMNEAHAQVKECEEFMTTYIIDCYPEVLAEVQTKRCCKLMLYSQREMIEEIYEHGLIKELEFLALLHAIDTSIQIVTFQGIPSLPVIKDVLSNRFTSCSPEEINTLLSKIVEKKYEPGENLFTEGEPADGAFFIIRGRVKEWSSWIDQQLIIGNIVGVQHLIEEFSHNYTSTAQSITSTVVAHIPKEVLCIEGLIEDLYKEASEEMVLLNRERYDLLDAKEVYILRIIASSEVKSLRKGKKISFIDGCLILKGKVQAIQKRWFIRPSSKVREVSEDSIVMMLPTDFLFAYEKSHSMTAAFKKFCVKVSNEITITKASKDEGLLDVNDSKLEDTTILIPRSESMKYSLKFRSIVPQTGLISPHNK